MPETTRRLPFPGGTEDELELQALQTSFQSQVRCCIDPHSAVEVERVKVHRNAASWWLVCLDMALRQQIGEGLEFCATAEAVFPESACNPMEEPGGKSTIMRTHCAKIDTKKNPCF